MKRLPLTAILESPLAIKRNRQSDRSPSAAYVPGSTLRGALADLHLQQHGEPDDTFRRLFLDEVACRFSHLDPAPHIFPRSASACKRKSVEHGAKDLLWLRVAQGLNGGPLTSEF